MFNRVSCSVIAAAMTATTLFMAAQTATAQTTEPKADLQALPASFLEMFLELPPGLSKRTYFELITETGDIGFSDMILRSVADEKTGTRYDYEHSMAFRSDDGTRVEAVVTAELSTKFRPRLVVTKQTVTRPNGEVSTNTIKTTFSNSRMVIDNPRNTDEPHRVVNIPNNTPVLAGLDAAVELAQFDRQRSFILAEANPTAGRLDAFMGGASPRDGGGLVVDVKRLRGGAIYRIELDEEGKLLRWDNIQSKFSIKRCSKERFEIVKTKVFQ
ncbi:MAG: hypothetical protein ACPGXK_07540 [Phycisphaerae bacterium]